MEKDHISIPWSDWIVDESVPVEEGGFGSVYIVRREIEGVTAYSAVKLIPNRRMSKRRFDEIKMMVSFKDCPNIVRIEDWSVAENGDIYIRMERLEPLPDLACRVRADEKTAIKLGADICTALETLHSNHILHRDIKPGNILRDNSGRFKLGDFGISRETDGSSGYTSIGTYDYVAPEVFSGRYDERADIYSLGLVLYEFMNNRELPAPSARMNGEKLPPPANASPLLAEVILRAVSFRPEDRFGSASEMKAALLAAAEGRPVEKKEKGGDFFNTSFDRMKYHNGLFYLDSFSFNDKRLIRLDPSAPSKWEYFRIGGCPQDDFTFYDGKLYVSALGMIHMFDSEGVIAIISEVNPIDFFRIHDGNLFYTVRKNADNDLDKALKVIPVSLLGESDPEYAAELAKTLAEGTDCLPGRICFLNGLIYYLVWESSNSFLLRSVEIKSGASRDIVKLPDCFDDISAMIMTDGSEIYLHTLKTQTPREYDPGLLNPPAEGKYRYSISVIEQPGSPAPVIKELYSQSADSADIWGLNDVWDLYKVSFAFHSSIYHDGWFYYLVPDSLTCDEENYKMWVALYKLKTDLTARKRLGLIECDPNNGEYCAGLTPVPDSPDIFVTLRNHYKSEIKLFRFDGSGKRFGPVDKPSIISEDQID